MQRHIAVENPILWLRMLIRTKEAHSSLKTFDKNFEGLAKNTI